MTRQLESRPISENIVYQHSRALYRTHAFIPKRRRRVLAWSRLFNANSQQKAHLPWIKSVDIEISKNALVIHHVVSNAAWLRYAENYFGASGWRIVLENEHEGRYANVKQQSSGLPDYLMAFMYAIRWNQAWYYFEVKHYEFRAHGWASLQWHFGLTRKRLSIASQEVDYFAHDIDFRGDDLDFVWEMIFRR